MTRPRKYSDNAHRQAAYRARRQQAISNQMNAKGLPAMPVLPTMPGWSRWKQAIHQAQALIIQVHNEMEQYYSERTEQWQESERAELFQQKTEHLTDIQDLVSDWLSL